MTAFDQAVLEAGSLHSSLGDPAMTSMTFLNEIANLYPDAISFAPGRPFEGFFDTGLVHRYLRRYERYLREERGWGEAQIRRTMLQYGRTNGIIHELIARNLATDEAIRADPESIVVTVGCQEAMFLVLRALRAQERDVVLSVMPGYVGLTGAARLVDMRVLGVRSGPHGIDLDDLRRTVHEAREAGLRPRACYVVPDFANPSGISMDPSARHSLLDLADREDLLLLEDNPYGVFTADGERRPTLKALDGHRRVVYLGSFAKTGLPGARIGFALADQQVVDDVGKPTLLATQLAKIKSMLTVNTSPIAQAVVAGKLLEHDYSMVRANERETAVYRRNRNHLLAALAHHFPAEDTPVRWNTPGGGFFLVLTVPFIADNELLTTSARDYGVLWTPMSYFHDTPETARQIRLSYSLVTPGEIDEGLNRLAKLVDDHT